MQSISLADELTLDWAPSAAAGDEVLCPGVDAQNLAGAALAAFREATGWDAPPLRLSILKRIPVAAGLGGGSGDAAAALRLAAHASGLADDLQLRELGASLGADVPAQIAPGRWLARGAGELLEQLPDPTPPYGVLVLAVAGELSTAAVYAEADLLGLHREGAELDELHGELHAALDFGTPVPTAAGLSHNDLQQAAISLCPAIDEALDQARDSGADVAFVSGSGPTVIGLFTRANALARAERAAAGLAGREPAPVVATPVGTPFARPAEVHVRNN